MTEKELEDWFIAKLGDLRYTPPPEVGDGTDLESNFRKHLNDLNRMTFTEDVCSRASDDIVAADSLFPRALSNMWRTGRVKRDTSSEIGT